MNFEHELLELDKLERKRLALAKLQKDLQQTGRQPLVFLSDDVLQQNDKTSRKENSSLFCLRYLEE